jgi:hypothetical protein
MCRNPPCKRVQLDKIWSFVRTKQTNVATAKTAPDRAGVTDRLWEISDIVSLWESVEPTASRHGFYKNEISV